MTAIVLIHGSTQNATAWDLVRPLLEDQGHQTIAIDLPPDRPDLSATDFAWIAVEQMKDAPDDCVVVAHSASGILLPRIAMLRRVGALVYLAAMIPQPGKSAMQQYEEHREMFNPAWIAASPKWADPANWLALADEFLFHDVYAANREFAHSTLRVTRFDAALREPLDGDVAPVPAMCVIANRDRTIDPEWQRRTWEELDLVTVSRADTGHCPHIASPREVAGPILYMARTSKPSERVDYDTYAQLPRHEQVRIFNVITFDNRAEIVRTQVRRWLDTNRHRLSNDQIALMEENIRLIQPRLYERPRDRELHAKLEQLMERMFVLFPREDIFHATVAGAPYIPPPP